LSVYVLLFVVLAALVRHAVPPGDGRRD